MIYQNILLVLMMVFSYRIQYKLLYINELYCMFESLSLRQLLGEHPGAPYRFEFERQQRLVGILERIAPGIPDE